jgi:hypothetical protein
MFPVPTLAEAPGISEVQWFAGLAMHAIIAKQDSIPDTGAEREEIALWAIRMGEAMAAMGNQLNVQPSRTVE